MFFFKQNYEQIQEIQHILEKCNLNIKDLSEKGEKKNGWN